MANYEIRKVQSVKDSNTGLDSSFCFVLPKKMCESLEIGKGSYVKMQLDEDNKRVIIERMH